MFGLSQFEREQFDNMVYDVMYIKEAVKMMGNAIFTHDKPNGYNAFKDIDERLKAIEDWQSAIADQLIDPRRHNDE